MSEEELNIKIGARIAQIRRDNGLSQSDLAAIIDSEKQNVSRLERGLVNPGLYFLYKVSDALQISLKDLLDFEN